MLLFHSKNRRGLYLIAVKSLPQKRPDCLLCAEEIANVSFFAVRRSDGQIAQQRNWALCMEK